MAIDNDVLAALTQDEIKKILEDLEKDACERSLAEFVKVFWPVMEPSTPLVWGWTMDAICQHLEAVTDGRITRLIINVPPGFSKSSLLNVFWCAHEWGPKRMPHLRYISTSYSYSLTQRDNIRFRRIIMSEKYKKYWGDVFGPSHDQFTTTKVANDKTGWKLATSLAGVTTGERGNRVLIDDGNNVMESESPQVLETTNMWVREVMPDRLNNIEKDAIVNIQQRTAENDVTGTLLSLNLGYEHLMIPMEYDPDRHCTTSIGWTDPRKKEGELAFPERFPLDAVQKLRRAKGEFAWASQYAQSPSPRGGGIIPLKTWRIYGDTKYPANPAYKDFPNMEYIVAGLDTAYTEAQENDYSALVVFGLYRDQYWMPKIMLMHAWQERLKIHDLVTKVNKSCERYQVDRLLIEDKAAGHSVQQELARLFRKRQFGIELVHAKGDKVARAYSVQHLFTEGMIYAPWDGEFKDWARLVMNQLAVLPKGAHDDLADAAVYCLRYLRTNGFALSRDEQQDVYDEKFKIKPPEEPLYDC